MVVIAEGYENNKRDTAAPSPNSTSARVNREQQQRDHAKSEAAELNWRAKAAAEIYRVATIRE